MKKFLAILLAAVLCLSLAACGGNGGDETTAAGETTAAEETTAADTTAEGDTTAASEEKATADQLSKLKIGIVLLHNETVGYDENFINSVKNAVKNLGLDEATQVIFKKDIPEDKKCYDACVELAEEGCNLIFADSFSHEEYVIEAAKEFTDVQFFHATGVNAKIVNLPNFHNAFAKIFEGRYLAGVVAGLKLNELIEAGTIKEDEAKIGYIGAKPYAEVISGYTSFFLGARSICPSATMEVTYTNEWANLAKEQEAAKKLIKDGCVIISEHADTDGSPMACDDAMTKENKTVYHIGYNIDFNDVAPTANLVSSKIDWTPYFEHIFNGVAMGAELENDYCGDFTTDSVLLTEYNDKNVTDEMKAKVDEVKADLESGKIKVFDTSTFTVKDESTIKTNEANFVLADNYKTDADGHLTSYMADAVADEKYTPDTDVIKDGEFAESSERSAPYFNVNIDGIDVIG